MGWMRGPLGAFVIALQPLVQRAGVKFDKVVVVVIEIQRLPLAFNPWSWKSDFETKFNEGGLGFFQACLIGFEGDVIVAARWQALAFHDGNPDIPNDEKLFSRDGKLLFIAGIDLLAAENLDDQARHFLDVRGDEGDVGEAGDHYYYFITFTSVMLADAGMTVFGGG